MNRLWPDSETELAEIVRDAQALGQNLVPVGGELSLSTSNITSEPDHIIDLAQFAGISNYVPSDLTLCVGAGTRFGVLQAALAEHGQEIPIDIPFPEIATVGGVVATGFAGPRRLSSGTMKDLLIGCAFVQGDGLAAKAGGMVVKNVSGFEIPRLLHGSWGALAIITSVNLKVLPRPREEATLLADLDADLPGACIRLVQRTQLSVAGVAAATIERRDGKFQAAFRVTGREPAVIATIAEIRATINVRAEEVRRGEASKSFWQDQTDRWSASNDNSVQVAIGMLPAQISGILDQLSGQLGAALDGVDLLIQPGTGATRLKFHADFDTIKVWWTTSVVSAIGEGAAAVIEAAPVQWREGVNVWGADSPARNLMRDVKAAFDPHHVLNRGRLFV